MRYRVYMSVELDASDDHEAHENALKLEKLLRDPMVRMAAHMQGVTLSGDPVVHHPRRES